MMPAAKLPTAVTWARAGVGQTPSTWTSAPAEVPPDMMRGRKHVSGAARVLPDQDAAARVRPGATPRPARGRGPGPA